MVCDMDAVSQKLSLLMQSGLAGGLTLHFLIRAGLSSLRLAHTSAAQVDVIVAAAAVPLPNNGPHATGKAGDVHGVLLLLLLLLTQPEGPPVAPGAPPEQVHERVE